MLLLASACVEGEEVFVRVVLEYEQSVVYRPDAGLPSYLVVYKLNSPLPRAAIIY